MHLDPIPSLDRSVLPSWIKDFGVNHLHGEQIVVMTAQFGDEIFHVEALCPESSFDDTFWVRYAEPMVNSIGGALFEAEHPGKMGPSYHWDALSSFGEPITEEQKAIIARRKELTWTSPTRVFPD